MDKARFDLLKENLINGSFKLKDYSDELNTALTQCSYKCMHKPHQHGQTKRFNICEIASIIVAQHKMFNVFDDLLTKRFLSIMVISQLIDSINRLDRTKIVCAKQNQVSINQFLELCYQENKLLKRADFVDMLNNPYFYGKYLDDYLDTQKIDTLFIYNACVKRVDYLISREDIEVDPLPPGLISKLLENYKIEGVSNNLLFVRHTGFQNEFSKLLDKYDGSQLKFNQELLYQAVKRLPYSRQNVIVLLSKGLTIDEECLELVLDFCCQDTIALQFILDRYEGTINESHLKRLINSTKYIGQYPAHYVNYNNARLLKPDSSGYSKIKGSGFTNEAFQLLLDRVDDASVLSIELIDLLIENKIDCTVNFGSKVNIQELTDICNKKRFYPEMYFKLISQMKSKIVELRRLCINTKIADLRKFFKKNPDTVPDEQCLIMAFNTACTMKVFQLLLEKGGQVTPKCLLFPYNCSLNCSQQMLTLKIQEVNKYHQSIVNDLQKQLDDAKLKKIYFDENNVVSKRKKNKVSQVMLDLNHPDGKLSFYDIKNWIIDQDWFKNRTDNSKIIIPDEICDKLGISYGYIVKEEVDSFVSLFC